MPSYGSGDQSTRWILDYPALADRTVTSRSSGWGEELGNSESDDLSGDEFPNKSAI
jgi:hypothetical protein